MNGGVSAQDFSWDSPAACVQTHADTHIYTFVNVCVCAMRWVAGSVPWLWRGRSWPCTAAELGGQRRGDTDSLQLRQLLGPLHLLSLVLLQQD